MFQKNNKVNFMGTSKGNIGRKMYKDPLWRKSVSEGGKLERIKIEKKCPKCETYFYVERTVRKNGMVFKPKKEKTFCSRTCANTKTFTKEQNKSKGRKKEKVAKQCLFCNKSFISKNKKFCSAECFLNYTRKDLDTAELKYYRSQCSFNYFSLSDYPEEFNFALIEEFGWYKAKNRGNNLNGVSRDHIVSVKYGWENNIDPKIISHPANCQLMLQSNNSSKGESCNMNLDDLLIKISEWNKKYGLVV